MTPPPVRTQLLAALLVGAAGFLAGCGDCVDCLRVFPAHADVLVLDTADAPVAGVPVSVGVALICPATSLAGHSICELLLSTPDSLPVVVHALARPPYHQDSLATALVPGDTVRVTLRIGGM